MPEIVICCYLTIFYFYFAMLYKINMYTESICSDVFLLVEVCCTTMFEVHWVQNILLSNFQYRIQIFQYLLSENILYLAFIIE